MNPEGSGSSESALIETVQQQLLQGGVKAEKTAMVARTVVTSVETFHSGPLPSVETFFGYEKACPGRLIPLTQVTPTYGIADDLRAAGGE